MSPRNARPPGIPEALLRAALPPGVIGDSIVGDAREEYAEYVREGGVAPGLWYWTHAIRLAASYLVTRGRNVRMEAILKDLRFGARSLMRMPGSAAVAVVVLAIGIGLCSFMFSIIYGVYFRGMDIPESDRVLLVYETNLERNQQQRNVPIQNFVDWRERQTAFEDLLGLYSGTVNVAGAEEPIRFGGAFVTANTFDVLHVQPIMGRGFVEEDGRPGAPPHVILSYAAWRDQFGGEPSAVGRDVRVNGEPATILGVMPEGFEFPNNTEIWVPLREDPMAAARGEGRYLTVWGRLRDGVTEDRAATEMAGIARQLEQEHPEVNEGVGTQLFTPIEANTDETLNMVFGAMMFAVICVLLVACANVASLLLSRAAMRTKEAGLRVALGGSRLRVMLPFLAESLVLAAAGAALGIAIAYTAVAWFDGVTDPALTGRPWFMQFSVDLPILLFVVGLTVVTALIAGLAPAFQMSRTDVSTVLKDESRGSSGLQVGRLSRILVTAEVALSCALLVGAGLMTKSIVNLGNLEHPFEAERLLTARVGLFEADYPDEEARRQFWIDLHSEIEALPQVEHAALTDILPYQGRNTYEVSIDGVDYGDSEDRPPVNRVSITPGYFDALRTELISGRDFNDADDVGAPLVAIVNQPMVDRYFDGENPIGRSFRQGASDTLPSITVVGVAPDLQMMGGQPEAAGDYEPAGFYVPVAQQDFRFLSIAALARGDVAGAVTGDVRGAVRRLDPNLPIYNVFAQTEVIERSTWFYGVFGTVFIAFGLAALFMASVGLYGVLSFAVSRRTQEMGIRMALGAASGDVVRLVARQGAGQLALGLLIGLGLAFGVTRLVSVLMFQVDPQDPVVFGAVFGLIVAVGMAAAVFPARRATGVNPVQALRAE